MFVRKLRGQFDIQERIAGVAAVERKLENPPLLNR
jgi:hypothetical protein